MIFAKNSNNTDKLSKKDRHLLPFIYQVIPCVECDINKYKNIDEKINELTQKINYLQDVHTIKDEKINELTQKNRELNRKWYIKFKDLIKRNKYIK